MFMRKLTHVQISAVINFLIHGMLYSLVNVWSIFWHTSDYVLMHNFIHGKIRVQNE